MIRTTSTTGKFDSKILASPKELEKYFYRTNFFLKIILLWKTNQHIIFFLANGACCRCVTTSSSLSINLDSLQKHQNKIRCQSDIAASDATQTLVRRRRKNASNHSQYAACSTRTRLYCSARHSIAGNRRGMGGLPRQPLGAFTNTRW